MNNKKNNLVRIQKIIADFGYCSRREAEKLIEKGIVTKNDIKIKLGDKADPKKDTIKINNIPLKNKPKPIYIMLNKPKGYVCATTDKHKKPITDLLKDKIKQPIYPVGRLDINTTGLLLLTNDGEWKNKLTHPKFEVEKEYTVTLDKHIPLKVISRINKGITLFDGPVKPKIKLIDDKICNISLHVGKNKIVKRIFKKFGFNVIELNRTRVGNFKLDNLKIGEFKHIKP